MSSAIRGFHRGGTRRARCRVRARLRLELLEERTLLSSQQYVIDPIVGTGTFTLVPNGGFETGSLMPQWGGFGGIGDFIASTNAIDGQYCAKTDTNSPTPASGSGYAIYQTISGFTPGATYVLSGYLRTDGLPNGDLYLDMNDIPNDPAPGYFGISASNNLPGWFFSYQTFVANAATMTVRMVRDAYFNNLSGAGYIDDVAITPVNQFVPPQSAFEGPATNVYDPVLGTGSFQLVPNGGFETGATTPQWGAGAGAGVGGIGNFIISTNAFDGNYSAASETDFPTPSTGTGYAWQQTITGLVPGSVYVLSGFFNTGTLASGDLYLDMNGIPGDPTPGFAAISATNKPTGWFFSYQDFLANSPTMTVRMVRDAYFNDVSGMGYIDDLAVTPASQFVPVSQVNLGGPKRVYNPIGGTGSFRLVPNGGFETGSTGPQWTASGGIGDFITSTNAFDGSYSAVTQTLAPTPSNGFGYADYQFISGLTIGDQYILSGYFNSSGLQSGDLYLDMNDIVGDPAPGYIGYRADQYNPPGWFFGYQRFVANASTMAVRMVRDAYFNDLAGLGYIDDVAITPAGLFAAPASVPLQVSSIAPVSPGTRNAPVSSIDVTFNELINATSLGPGALSITDNGGANLNETSVSISLVSGTTYQISGLSGLTAGNGNYTLTVNAAGINDQNGNPGNNSRSTSWLMDTSPPTSHVNALPARQTSRSFSVSVTASDLGNPASGVAAITIFASQNGGPWAPWITASPSNPTATFTGQSNTTYAFYSLAIDRAGNPENKAPVIEASTYLPNLSPPVTTVNGTGAANPSALNIATGTFTLKLTGSDPAGSLLTYFEVFASIDGGAYQEVGPYAIPAGAADGSGNYHSTIIYQGLTDGLPHSYAFYSIGFDAAGNIQSAPATPNVSFTSQVFAAPGQLQVTGFTVEHGSPGRSYIRYLDLIFNESDASSGGALTAIVSSISTASPDILIYKYDLNGTPSSKTAVPLASPVSLAVVDRAIEIDFGKSGLGGSPNTTSADGYYEVDIDPPGGVAAVHHFYRLLGDVNGDHVVDQNDLNQISAAINDSAPAGFAPLSADVTGAGTVSALDFTQATRSKGRKLGTGLPLG
jgi:hypothetical protein